MTAAYKISDYGAQRPATAHAAQAPPTGGVWRDIGQVGWQHAWFVQIVRSGLWARLKGSQTSVLGVLLGHANTHGQAWPSPATLARLSGQAERSVQLAISQLVAMRLIERRPADDLVGRSYFQILRSSDWAVDGDVMAATHAAPARQHQAQPHAPEAQPDAPQAQPRAPKAQPIAPPSIGGTRPEHTSSSERPAPNCASSPRRDPQPGLFDDDVMLSLLLTRGFRRGNAASLIATHGRDRMQEAIAHCDFEREKRKALGKPIRNYCGFLTHFLAHDMTADPASKPKPAPTPKEDLVVIRHHMRRLLMRRPQATQAECFDFARRELGWPDARWHAATKSAPTMEA